MIPYTFDHPDYTKHTYNLTILEGKVYVYAFDGTPLGVVGKIDDEWQQISGREFHHEMALAIGAFVENNFYI